MKYLIIIDSPYLKDIKVIGRCETSKQAIELLDHYQKIYWGENVKLAEVCE